MWCCARPALASGHKNLISRYTVRKGSVEKAAVTKITSETEATAYRELMEDAALRPHLPELYDTKAAEGDVDPEKPFVLFLQDVTAQCQAPCIMDIKLGTRDAAAQQPLAPARPRAPGAI